jgi:Fe-S-cluster containining protein
MKMEVINLIEYNDGNVGRADIPITPQEVFINDVYSSMDVATADGLDLLKSEDGIVPTCKAGCDHCCRYHIVTNSAEVHTLVQFLKRELSAEQMSDLHLRTQRWHEWDSSRRGRSQTSEDGGQGELDHYDHSCPLLVSGQCSVYAVRPAICRSHYVTSDAVLCRSANDPDSTEDVPQVVAALMEVASPFTIAIKEHIESEGVEFSDSATLLPQGLAIEMGWDFSVTP